MSASTSAGSADSRCPLPLGTRYGRRPVHLGAQSSRPARGEGQRDRRGRRVAGNSGQPGRRVTSKTVAILAGPRYPSASVESAAPPSVEELRQVVPVSDMRRRLGAGPARCRMAGGYWLPTGAAGSSVSRCEPSNALLPPAARTSGERLDCQHARRIHLSASRAGPRPTRTRTWLVPRRPFAVLQHAAQTAAPP
jgi:hypothetical protein